MRSPQADIALTQLALAAGRGDRAALTEFVRLIQRDIWRYLASLDGAATADDMTQETFVRILGALPRFSGRSSARTWALSIARRVLVDHIRAQSARPRKSVVEVGDVARQTAGHESVVEVELLLAELPAERREALVLTQLLGLSYDEAAAVLGCPVGTIRSRVARAREQLIELGIKRRGNTALGG